MTGTLRRPLRGTGDDDRDDPAPTHPRIARRRAEVRVERRRRRRGWWWAVAVTLVVVALGVGTLWSPLFAVDGVVVRGAPEALAAQVREATGVSVGDPMVRVAPAEVRRRVDRLPAVASSRVRLRWPDRVVVSVVPQRTVAELAVAGTRVEVGPGGRVLRVVPADAPAPTVPSLEVAAELVAGAPPAVGGVVPAGLAEALVVVEQLPPSLAVPFARGRVAADGTLEFLLPDDGGTVRLGPPEDVPAKLLAAETMLTGPVDRDCLDVLDLREPTRPTISRVPRCTLRPPTVGGSTTTTTPAGRRSGPTTTVPAGRTTPTTAVPTTVVDR